MKKYQIPIVILILGFLLSVGRFLLLRSFQNDYIQGTLRLESAALVSEIKLALEARSQAIERMALRLEKNLDITEEERESDAFAIYRHMPGFQAFEIADENHIVRWVYPLEGNQSVLSSNIIRNLGVAHIIQETTRTGREMIASPIPLEEDSFGFTIIYPLYAKDERPNGHMLGVFRNDSFFNSLALRNDIFISVFDKDKLVYSNEIRNESDPHWQIKLPFSFLNTKWQLSFMPTKELIARNRSFFPIINALVFMLFTVLLALVVFQFQQRRQVERTLEEERRKTELESFQSAKLASIGEIAAGVCHEINNPLTIIKGFAYKIRQTLNTESALNKKKAQEILDYLDFQDSAIHRIVDIVSGLRTFAKMDTETIENFDLHKAITDTVKVVEYIYRSSDIQIELMLNAKNSMVYGNVGNIRQVLMNFLSNSAYALTQKYNKVIEIETMNIGNTVVLKFSDNGAGISEKNLGRIFEPFFTTKPPGQGTGLGLGISYGIISKMNGTIEVKSKVGVGTTFLVTLPFQTREDGLEEHAPRS